MKSIANNCILKLVFVRQGGKDTIYKCFQVTTERFWAT